MFGCVICTSASLRHICDRCLREVLAPSLQKRYVDDFLVFSFYKYSEIAPLLGYKHKMAGSFIFSQLAKISFTPFSKNFSFDEPISVVPIDDNTKNGYSHTAILAKALSGGPFFPEWGRLRAKNSVTYAGKSLEFRKNNPRNFEAKKTKHRNVVLVDDVVTTGTTLLEAREAMLAIGCEPLFAITLADARE